MTVLRRIRGVVGTAVTWALAWVIVVAPLALFGYWRDEPEWFFHMPLGVVARLLLALGVWGAVHGAVFAAIVMAVNRLGIDVLTLKRLVALGAIAGIAVPLCSGAAWWWWAFLPVDLPLTLAVTGLSCGLGSALAAITFTLAGPHRRTALPPGNRVP